VLANAGTDLRFIEVLEGVERLLGGPVARSSIKNSLAKRCSGKYAPLERVGKGRYRLRPA